MVVLPWLRSYWETSPLLTALWCFYVPPEFSLLFFSFAIFPKPSLLWCFGKVQQNQPADGKIQIFMFLPLYCLRLGWGNVGIPIMWKPIAAALNQQSYQQREKAQEPEAVLFSSWNALPTSVVTRWSYGQTLPWPSRNKKRKKGSQSTENKHQRLIKCH